MTQEQFEVLQKYEKQITAAAKCNFLRLSPSEFNELAAVYDSIYPPLRQSQRNCNTCRINALKSLFNAFQGEKAEREVKAQLEAKEKAEKEATEKPVESDKEGKQGFLSSIIKKKAGRPKKIDLEA